MLVFDKVPAVLSFGDDTGMRIKQHEIIGGGDPGVARSIVRRRIDNPVHPNPLK